MKNVFALVCTGLFLALMGCGGGGGGGGAQPLVTPQGPPPPTISPAGIWEGTGLNGRELVALVLDTGEYFAIYSATGNSAVIAGLVQGNGASSGSQFTSSNGLDFNFEGAGTIPEDLDATVVFRTSLNGALTADADPSNPQDFTSTFNPLYNQPPSLATVAGNYDGQLNSEAGAEFVSVVISSAGDITATGTSGCLATGTITPHSSGNAYAVQMTFVSSPCGLPNQTVAGAGSYDPDKNLLLLGLVDSGRDYGAVFSGSKDGGFDSDGDGVVDNEDADDDGDGVLDVDDVCPLDPSLNCRPNMDTITANGKVWAQVTLFTNLSWNDINAVCPAGNAGSCSGTLNGHDMTGWTWASVPELRALFNFYGFEPPQADDLTTQTLGDAAADAWVTAGWRRTSLGCGWELCYEYFEGHTREPYGVSMPYDLQGHLGVVVLCYTAPSECLGENYEPTGFYGSANPFSSVYPPPDSRSEGVGGWFYRSP